MKSRTNDGDSRHHLEEESQSFQLYINRRLKDSSKTESTTAKILIEKIFDLKMHQK